MDIPTPRQPQYTEQITTFDNLNIGDSVAVLDNNRPEVDNKNKQVPSRKYYYGKISKKDDNLIVFEEPDSSKGIGTSREIVRGAVIRIDPTEYGRLQQTNQGYLRIYKNPTAAPAQPVAPVQAPAQPVATTPTPTAVTSGGGTKRKRRRNKKTKRRYKSKRRN